MGKKTSKHITSAFLIGLFVIIGTTLMVGAIIWLGANKFMKENIEYVTYFSGSVEGLETGSPVKYQGVPIGTVKSIRVADDGRLIEIVMNLDREVDVTDSLRVKSELSGLAGGKFLQMHYPDNPEILDMYPRFNFEVDYPYIKSSPSGIDEIEIAARHVLDKMRRLKVDEISNETIAFLQTSTGFFKSKELSGIIRKLNMAAGSLNNILKSADTARFISNMDLTSKKLLQTVEGLEEFSSSLNNELKGLELKGKVDHAFSQYDTTIVDLRKVINKLGYRSEVLLAGLNETLEELRTTNRQLRKSLRAISDNPAQVFFSEPPPEED